MIQVFDQEIPNKMDELTIEQFEKISQILNNQEFDNIERYVEMFKYLGIKEEQWDDYPFSKFVELIKEFNLNSFTPSETVTSIEVDGYTYEAQLKLSVKETKLIEKIVNTKPNHYISDILAIMFKRTDLSNTEHFTDAHLKHKAKIFRNLKAEICVPYIVFVTEKISEYAQANAAEEVEPSQS
jgi:hypothetical protein